ncbi:glutamine amidotransferase [Paludibacterium paludis]|uniref:GMP synthase n=1 Tax=Paludibacterium paludis TaxID=1225769 RepID=A0A918UAH7_9NEIS|nr:glutamine amidotransferase [Paludibacterium paludis]GGY18938.1 GMP synthase [Paludibacterium paludis]
MKHALILRHLAFEHAGTLEDVLARHRYQFQYVDAPLADLVRLDIIGPDLVIVLGGPIGACDDERYPFLTAETLRIRERLASGKPLIGICLGAQLIAKALGQPVYPARKKEIGWQPLSWAPLLADSGISALARAPSMLHWHGDTFDLPDGATRLASTETTPNQIFTYRNTVLGLQCHPEIRPEEIESWLVGHAAELSAAGIDPGTVRADTLRYGTALANAAFQGFSDWLSRVEPR